MAALLLFISLFLSPYFPVVTASGVFFGPFDQHVSFKTISVESRVFAFLLRCVGEHGRRSRRLSGRPGRSGFGPKRAGETRRRESEGDEQEAAAHVGGAAHQEHAPAEGNGPHQHATWTVSTG